jgi:prepilin-type processing-associated H-X9-DG protein
MNQKNAKQSQKPKRSKLTIASISCLIAAFAIVALLNLDLPYVPDWIGVFFLVALIAAPILGICALFKTARSKVTLPGLFLSVIGIIIPMFVIIMLIPPRRIHLTRQLVCGINLKVLGTAIFVYTEVGDGYLPTSQGWCDLLITEVDVDPKSFVCPSSDAKEGQSSYTLNKNLVGFKISDDLEFEGVLDPEDVVLLFEAKPGWNQVGGKELLIGAAHKRNKEFAGCNVLFADGSARFIKTEALDTLRWKP